MEIGEPTREIVIVPREDPVPRTPTRELEEREPEPELVELAPAA
jgi:hypothetical protein